MIKKALIGVCVLFFLIGSSSFGLADQSIGYRYYLSRGIKALQIHDDQKAIRYFEIALIFDPDSKEVKEYLDTLLPPTVSSPVLSSSSLSSPALSSAVPSSPISVVPSAPTQPQTQSTPFIPKPVIYLTAPVNKGPVQVLSLAQLTNNGQIKPRIQVEINSLILIEGKNIQRFLVVDEGYIGVKTINSDRIEIDALKIGTTFLHIWDDSGRQSLYIEVVFPRASVSSGTLQENNGVIHSQPFTFTYSNDWSTYYSGKNIPALKKQSNDFNQSLSMVGETPYGILDASGSYSDYNSFSEFDTYTIGLSQIPLDGTSNFNLRGFDALRYLSPLTMPSTRLRGVFADVDLMQDMIGLSFSHGQEEVPLGFISMGGSQFNNTYVDAGKITLFPKSDTDRYSFNFATAYGADRQRYLSNHVYSLEEQHKFNDFLTFNSEQAADNSHESQLASLRWEDGSLKTGLHFRNIDKDFSTISSLPSNQGEVGASWTTDLETKNVSASSFFEAYRDRIDTNPNDPRALNYDANGHVKVDMDPTLWSDSDFNYVDTAGDLSPRRSLGANQRLSQSFGIWNSMRGVVFGGIGYQDSHSSYSSISDFTREDIIGGIQLPLTNRLSSFANDEYDWLNQPDAVGETHPNVINAGLQYQKQFNPKFSMTSQLSYRDELGVSGSASFLSGEESVILSSGIAYNPTEDISIFADANASKVISHIGNPSYDDFEVHVGMRITFGGATYWDPLGTVKGTVYIDRDGTGKFAAGDEGVAGVKVKVGDKVAITDKNGHYSIPIRAKAVVVYPELDTLPGGLLFSTNQSLNVLITQGHTTKADFGLISQTGIYGIVFIDKNGSGVPNDKDTFIGKVKVILDGKITQKSDSHGAFYFRKVSPGEHWVRIDINSLPLDVVPLIKLKNKIDVTEGTNFMFNIPVQIKKAQIEQG